MVYNISWKDQVTNKELYGNADKVTNTIKNQRLSLSGHVFHDETSPAQKMITWIPSHGQATRGRPTTTHVNTLLRDTGMENVKDLESCMEDVLCGARRRPQLSHSDKSCRWCGQ